LKRPPIDRSMSSRAQAIDLAILDLIEALEMLWADSAVLEELAKPQGKETPDGEAMSLAHYWETQKRLLARLTEARSAVVGSRHAVHRVVEKD